MYENDVLQFINDEEGRVVMTGAAPEYQYHLKDHLGNVRLTFSEETTTTEYKTDLEAATNPAFRNYGNRSAFNLFDHTDAGLVHTYSQLLNGGNNSQVGLAKSFAVNPGDVFDLEVYAKYEAPASTGNNVNNLVTALIPAFNLSSAGTTPLDGQQALNAFNNTFTAGPYIGRVPPYEDGAAPKAYLNYILFDENFGLVDFGFDQISNSAQQTGTTPVPHDYLNLHVKVGAKGYLYVYLSNEQAVQTNVYFDDFKIKYTTAIQQVQDYYPFGLTFNSYARENSIPNQYQYSGKELQNELNLGWLDFGARMYMPEIGRWGVIDPHADRYNMVSPYNYVFNSPINAIDPDGRDAIFTVTRNKKGEITGVNVSSTIYITGAGASEDRANELNKNSATVFAGNTIKSNVNVKLDIKYKYSEKISTSELKGGENILNFVDKKSVKGDSNNEPVVSHVNGYRIGENRFTGRTGEILKDDWSDDRTVYHESLHFTGLPDMYYAPYGVAEGSVEGFENDIMGATPNTTKIGYDHYMSYYQRAQEVYKAPGNDKKFSKGFINRKSSRSKEASKEQKNGQ